MDPDATLADVEWELRKDPSTRNVDELLAQLADLHEWMRKGGFAPTWRSAPVATKLYQILYTKRLSS